MWGWLMSDDPNRAREQWEQQMRDAGWFPLRDMFGALLEWVYSHDGVVAIVPPDTADRYRERGTTPPPF